MTKTFRKPKRRPFSIALLATERKDANEAAVAVSKARGEWFDAGPFVREFGMHGVRWVLERQRNGDAVWPIPALPVVRDLAA